MGVSTDGILVYGIDLGDFDGELPWGDDDVEDWWRTKRGYKPSREIYCDTSEDPSGYIGGKRPDESVINAYFEERIAFDKAHPMPFEEVRYCSHDYPMLILAVPGTRIVANRGDAIEIGKYTLGTKYELEVDAEADQKFVKAIEALGIEGVDASERKWLLCSMWG